MGKTEAESYDITKFIDTPFAVSFAGEILGGTEGPPSIKPEIVTEDISCNQAQGRVLKRTIKKITYTITAKFKQPETVLAKVFGLQNVTTEMLGTDLLAQAGELVLAAIGTSNQVFTFHSATAIVTGYEPDGEKLHTVDVEFKTTEAGDKDGKILTVSQASA